MDLIILELLLKNKFWMECGSLEVESIWGVEGNFLKNTLKKYPKI